MAIEEGNSDAMNSYGIMLERGAGVDVNKEEATHYYRMAAEKGNADGMNNYTLILEYGDGVVFPHVFMLNFCSDLLKV